MIFHEVIIVGGGPAGSTCAWKLKQAGIDCAIIDGQKFPRLKICGGWISRKVLEDLAIDIQSYPHRIIPLTSLQAKIARLSFRVKTPDYSIRRYEFDHWLLERSGAVVYNHLVRNIVKEGDRYSIDGAFSCKYIIGAGGT